MAVQVAPVGWAEAGRRRPGNAAGRAAADGTAVARWALAGADASRTTEAPGRTSRAPLACGRYAVERVDGVPDLRALAPHLGPGGRTVFQDPRWLRDVAGVAGARGAAPFTMLVRDLVRNRVVMVCPLAHRSRRALRVVEALDLGFCDYAAPLVDPGAGLEDAEIREIWHALLVHLPPTDLVVIERIEPALGIVANPYLALPGCRPLRQSYGLSLEGTPGDLLERVMRPASLAAYLAARGRPERGGDGVAFRRAVTIAEVDAVFAALLAQAADGPDRTGRPALFATPDGPAILRQAALDGLDGGPARLFGLANGERTVGTLFGLVDPTGFHLFLRTDDGTADAGATALLLTAEAMSWAAREGAGFFDLATAEGTDHVGLGAGPSPLYGYSAALTWRGALALALRRPAG